MAKMKYIVIMQDPRTGEQSAFMTHWFEADNYIPDSGMIVIDRTQKLITFDGETWQGIEIDNL